MKLFSLKMVAVLAVLNLLQTGMLLLEHRQLASMRLLLKQETAALASCQTLRTDELRINIQAAGNAEKSCLDRVAAAHESADRIRVLVEKPYVVDAKGCPARDVLGAGELRNAIAPSR